MSDSKCRRLEDRVAVITGGASGIGLATARRFADEGAVVVIGDLDPVAGQAVADEVNGLFVPTDVTDPDAVEDMFAAAQSAYGRIDIAFNNAGISPPDDDSILETGLDAWKRVQEVNLTSVFLCCKTVLPYMLQQGKGSPVAARASAWARSSCSPAIQSGLLGDWCTFPSGDSVSRRRSRQPWHSWQVMTRPSSPRRTSWSMAASRGPTSLRCRRIQVALAGSHKGLQQRRIGDAPFWVLGMPLHAEAEVSCGVLACLNSAVLRPTGDRQVSGRVNGLMVRGIDLKRSDAQQLGNKRAIRERGLMIDEVLRALAMVDARDRRQVLDQGAPVGHGHELHTATDAKDRHAKFTCPAVETDLAGIATFSGMVRRGIYGRAIQARIHISPSGQQQAVTTVDDFR